MRFFVALVLIVFLASCGGGNHPQPVSLKGYSQKSIRLANGLGIVSIYLPAELDTFYSFINFGEYHCAEVKMHRYFAKKYACCPSPEVDFNYSEMPDSAYQFTIAQTYNKDCEQYVTIDESLFKNMQSADARIDKEMATKRKYTMREINGNKFIISELNSTINNTSLQEVEGITQADGRMVKFIFQGYGPRTYNFAERMMASLNTIQISPDEKGK